MQWLMSAEGYSVVLTASFIYAGLILIGAFMAKAPYGKLASANRGINL